jgi:hypothetical protein
MKPNQLLHSRVDGVQYKLKPRVDEVLDRRYRLLQLVADIFRKRGSAAAITGDFFEGLMRMAKAV